MARTNRWIPLFAFVAAATALHAAEAAPAAHTRPALERRGQDILPSRHALR